jgi:hypothetical protein
VIIFLTGENIIIVLTMVAGEVFFGDKEGGA